MANKILIIEDDEFLRGLISKKLSIAGYGVMTSNDGEAGAEKAKEEKPDLILLDLILPIMDGFEVLVKLKGDPETSSIPVIILSNLDQKNEIDRGKKLGAVDYLIKAQFTPEDIIAKVKSNIK